MAISPSPTNSPIDDADRALLDSFNQGLAQRAKREDERNEAQRPVPEAEEDVTNVNLHQGSTAAAQALGGATAGQPPLEAGDDPFAAIKSGTVSRGTIDLPGPRSDYRMEETADGTFTIEHLASGEEVRVSGVEYLRFSDLQLHSEFLTRTNPQVAALVGTAPSEATQSTAAPAAEPESPAEADTSAPPEPPRAEASDGFYDSAFTGAEDGSITFTSQDLLGTEPDEGTSGTTVITVSGSANGTLVDNGDDSWTFTPDRDFDGTVELEITIADGQGGFETATATIEIAPTNDNPVAEDQSQTALEDGGIAAGSVVASDADGDALTYSLVSRPAEGAVTVNADGSYSFDPGNDFQDLGVGQSREVIFTYQVSDGQGGSDSGSVTITVAGTNDGPVASESTATATEDGGDIKGNLLTVDTDGDSLTHTLVSGPDEGIVTLSADGSFSFDPDSDFQDLGAGQSRDASFTYEADDDQGGTSQSTVTITVNGGNDGPVAGNQNFEVSGDAPIVITQADLLSGASDIDGDVLSVSFVGNADNGSLSDNGDGTWTFTPADDFTGQANFGFNVSDGQGGVVGATATIDVVSSENASNDSSADSVGTDGDDDIQGDRHANVIDAKAGDDRIDGRGGDDSLFGGAGQDQIHGNQGDDVIDGGAGDDRIRGDRGQDTIDGGAGDDWIRGGSDGDSLFGEAGQDQIHGNQGDDVIEGGAGDDRIRGDRGQDTIDGGAGDDWIRGGSDGDSLFGEAGQDQIHGNQGDDVIEGGAGDDRIRGDRGQDTIDGGAGDDWIRGGSDGDSLFGGAGQDQIHGNQGDDVIEGGAGDDRIRGDRGHDTIDGGAGDDWIRGGSDGDSLFGEAGQDQIHGNQGDDVIEGGAGDDRIRGDRGQDTIDGGAGDDWIRGGSDGDSLFGEAGQDQIHGNQGDDVIEGGAGDDRIRGDRGQDTIDGGAGDDWIRGGSDGDSLFGEAGDDMVDGGRGDDLIDGGAGDDIMDGGRGQDTFLLDSVDGIGDDQIDGGSGSDTIDLSSAQDWTVTYENGDSFTANDTMDTGLFTDTAGTIDFANGDQVSFENVESFNW